MGKFGKAAGHNDAARNGEVCAPCGAETVVLLPDQNVALAHGFFFGGQNKGISHIFGPLWWLRGVLCCAPFAPPFYLVYMAVPSFLLPFSANISFDTGTVFGLLLMPEGKGAHGPSGPINQPSPRSGVSLGYGRGSGPGLTSSSAFGSVAQGPAGRVGTRRTRGPWNTVGPQGQGYAAKAPWVDGIELSGAGRDQTGGWQSDPKPPAIRKNRQAAFGLPEPPVWSSLSWRRCGVRLVRTPPTRPSDRHPHGPLTRARATMIQSLCIGSERQDTGY